MALNMSTLESEQPEVDIFQPPTPSRTVMRTTSKREPKHRQLPQELIRQWTSEDMGFPEEEGEVVIKISIDSLENNHNRPVTIVLPPEAEEAIEVPLE